MFIEIEKCSFCGGRDYNEDSVEFFENGSEGLLIVADGLGGHGGGKIASEKAIEIIGNNLWDHSKNSIQKNSDINKIFAETNNSIIDMQTNSIKMKTTAVVSLIDKKGYKFAHVGDARAYHFFNQELIRRTIDHSVSQLSVLSGDIKEDEIRFNEDRNRLLKALGSENEPTPTIVEGVFDKKGRHAFLLCTDGFWEYIIENEMIIELIKSESPKSWLQNMVRRISKNVGSNCDNFSAVAGFVYVK